jgi:hypothetical protein
MLRTLKELIRPLRIDDPAGFAEFASGESALIAQKTAVTYCRAKTLTFSHALFAEKRFQEALTICRFEAFAAVLADVLLVAEGILRPHVDGERLAGSLRSLYSKVLAEQAVPPHRTHGWDDVIAAFAERLESTRAAPPEDARTISQSSAKRLFDMLPLHTNYRNIDEELIVASVTFQVVALRDKMVSSFDAPALARSLTG